MEFRVCTVLVLYVCFAVAVSGHGVLFLKIKERLLKQRLEEYGYSYKDPPPNVTTSFMEQPLDHFDPLVSGIIKQRYHVIDDYWYGPDRGPVILYIGGEGPLDPSQVSAGHHLELAKKYGCLVFGVEHRFYGMSIPEHGLDMDILQHLSSQQALADLASFIAFVKEKYLMSNLNIWISVGGSYPGSLSAWLQIKYSHLIYGALSSSAPVRAQVDFQGYNDVVKASLGDTGAGGSTECVGNVTAAFATVDSLVANKTFQKLKDDFQLCQNLSAPLDLEVFGQVLGDPFMGIVQYNQGVGNKSSIAGACAAMMATADPYQNLVNFERGIQKSFNMACIDVSYKAYLTVLNSTLKAWIYQTCTQFGYYQTCDVGSQCPFSHQHNLDLDLAICKDLFGIPSDVVFRQSNFTNEYYGSDHPKNGRVLFINGSIDPWHSLSVLKNLGGNETAIFINGTSHCEDMYGHMKNLPPALGPALDKIDLTFGTWIAEAVNDQ